MEKKLIMGQVLGTPTYNHLANPCKNFFLLTTLLSEQCSPVPAWVDEDIVDLAGIFFDGSSPVVEVKKLMLMHCPK